MDLKKYEGHAPAPWRVSPNSRYKIRADENLPEGVHHWHIAQVMNDRGGKWEDMCKANAQLIADAPLLLAEVKVLQHKLMLAESALGEIRAYHESGQGNLDEIIEHYQKNEQVEMPNIFDETKED